MQGAPNTAGETWHITRNRLDRLSHEWVVSWSDHAPCGGAKRGHQCGCPPSREIRARTTRGGRALVVDDDKARVYFNMPAAMTATIDVDEGYRTTRHDVTIHLVLDESGSAPRVVVDSVTIHRAGSTPVTAATLRLPLGALVDFMMTRAPVVETSEWVGSRLTPRSGFLGSGHASAAEALRVADRRTGKRGAYMVDVDKVARVAAAAPRGGQTDALRKAFPGVNRRTLQRALSEARAGGLLPASTWRAAKR